MTTQISPTDPLPSEPPPSTVGGSFSFFRFGPTVLSLYIVLYVALLSFLSIERHQRFLTHAFDMGQMTQALWKIRHGYGNFSTVTGLSILGDHSRFILYPLALFPVSPEGLLIFQTLVFASGAIPIYLMTKNRSSTVPALFLSAIYLAHPSLQWMNLFDFHPEAIAGPLLLWALWGHQQKKNWVYWVSIGIALLCREDVALAVMIVGAVIFLAKERVKGAITMGVGVLALIATTIVMKLNNPYGLSVFRDRYGWLGEDPADALQTLLLDAPEAFRRVPVPLAFGSLLFGYVAPASFALFSRPRRLWAFFPLIAVHSLSSLAQQRSIYFHYGFLILPLIFFAAVDGLPRLIKLRPIPLRATLAVLAVGVSLVSFVFHSPATDTGFRTTPGIYPRPASIVKQLQLTHPPGYEDEAQEAVEMIPPTGVVSSSANLLPHLARRPEIYMFPNPFYMVWYGPTISESPLPHVRPRMPDDPPEWVVADAAHRGPENDPLREELVEMLPDRYTLVFDGSFIDVWRLK